MDHVTVDQYDVTDDSIDDVEGALRGVVEKYSQWRRRHRGSGDKFEVHFKGDARLLNCRDLVRAPDFRSPAWTIETFRQRAAAAAACHGSFADYNRGAGAAAGGVTGSFRTGPKRQTKVALVSCEAVGHLRHLLEGSSLLSASRGAHMPAGGFVAHMTIGRGDDQWPVVPVAMDRLKRNMGIPGLGRSGGRVVWSVPGGAEAEEKTLLEW